MRRGRKTDVFDWQEIVQAADGENGNEWIVRRKYAEFTVHRQLNDQFDRFQIGQNILLGSRPNAIDALHAANQCDQSVVVGAEV